ncbi:MarR family winged helix-turn-helix transcriptional regulator [Nocardia jejuensis]|uniref:MarR family winged helix-turn-helix transcriptional regulator n=1 Tax=Nocardia jejuensis TaxID=328049 RepID=UPI00082C166D|nr:MarR family winged helix-turn-helix transcriptional regulator [Nocardia jejuensis]
MEREDAVSPSLSSRFGYLLVRSALRVRQRYVNELSTIGLLPNQHAILSTLNELGACHQKELAARIGLDTGDIVAYLDGLDAEGFVERNRDPADRRRQVVSLLPAGKVVLATADRVLDAVEAETFGCLDPAERVAFGRSLDRLYESLTT